MRLRLLRPWGVATLYLLAHLGMAGCSASQEDGEDVEASEENVEEGNEEANEEANEESNEESNQEASEQGEEGAVAEEGVNGEEGVVTEEGVNGEEGAVAEEMPAEAPNATEESLKEIVSDINPADAGTMQAAVPAEAAPAPTPAVAPIPEAAPAPAVAAAPAGQGLPEIGSKMPYVVQHGDTLAKIAQKIYGAMDRWHDIAQLSGLANPNRIYPGDVVYYQLTEDATAFATAYEAQTKGEVTAAAGDTLAKISAKVLGSSKYWKSVWRQNDHIDNPDHIKAGTTVYYLQNAASASTMEVNSDTASMDVESTEDVVMSDMNDFGPMAASNATVVIPAVAG